MINPHTSFLAHSSMDGVKGDLGLKTLTSKIDCDLAAMGLPPPAVLLIAK
jgi:hypothetical protein